MPGWRVLMTAQILFSVCGGPTVCTMHTASAQSPSSETSNAFEAYFGSVTAAPEIGLDQSFPAYEKLAGSIETMTPAEIAAGIAVIDRTIDSTAARPQDRYAKAQAVSLLGYIGYRLDGFQLLASQMDRLTFLLNDPSHALSGPAVIALQTIGYRRPDVVWPILEAALKDSEVNNETGVGPGIAVILLRMRPHDDDVTEHVVQYMRRPDLTNEQLLDTIVGIDSSPVLSDVLAAELVRDLDRPDENIKSRALVGISKSSPPAKGAARARLQQMVGNPRETAHIRRLAAEALSGEIRENPNPKN